MITGRDRVESATEVADRDSMRREGFALGHAEGLAAARGEHEALRAELIQSARSLQSAVARIAQPIATLEAKLETELVRIALAVGAHLACGELRVDAARLAELIHRCTAALPPHAEAVRVRLNPADLRMLQTAADDPRDDSIEWSADESLQRGDCIVETRDSRVDARWSLRVAATIKAVLGDESL